MKMFFCKFDKKRMFGWEGVRQTDVRRKTARFWCAFVQSWQKHSDSNLTSCGLGDAADDALYTLDPDLQLHFHYCRPVRVGPSRRPKFAGPKLTRARFRSRSKGSFRGWYNCRYAEMRRCHDSPPLRPFVSQNRIERALQKTTICTFFIFTHIISNNLHLLFVNNGYL